MVRVKYFLQKLKKLYQSNSENKLLLLLLFIKLNSILLNYTLFCANCFHRNLIVYKSFHYKLQNRYYHSNKITTLFIADRTFDTTGIGCAQENSRTDSLIIARAKLDHSTSMGLCKFDLFVLQCHFKKYLPNAPVALGVLVKPRKFVKIDNIVLNRPNEKKRGFVICMSRVMAFEQWQLMVAVLEIYRSLKVDLVVAHVQSALSIVFELMKIYERDGLLSIRPGVRFPFLEGMPWDPNEQTEYSSQVALAHECFYEFRETTKFIAMIDWDDLLYVAPKFGTLEAAFSYAVRKKPMAAYFLVNKLHCNFVEQKSPRQFNLMLPKLYNESGICSAIYEGQKMVVRPKRIRSFWIHYSTFIERGTEELLTTNHSLLVHLANSFEVPKDEYKYPFFNRLNTGNISDNFNRNIWKRMLQSNLTSKLIQHKHYYKAYEKCHTDIVSYYKTLNPELCINYNICQIPRIKVNCTSVQSKFRSKCVVINGWRTFFVHTRETTKFVSSKNGC